MSDQGEPKTRRRLRAVPPQGPPLWPNFDQRPEVRLSSDSAKNVDALDLALSQHAPDVFQRGLQLVEVVAEKKPGLIACGAPVLRALNKYSLETHVARHLRCVRFEPPTEAEIKTATANDEEAEGEWSPSRANMETAILPMLAYGRWSKIRPISGITESPLFRPDGSIMQEAGYDAPTGYLYRPSCEYPPIPLEPTQQDARLAYESLRHVFCDFPYTSPAQGMVPIAALLTILARAAVSGNVPVFAFEASIQGAGKTMQGDIVHIIATGRYAPHSSFPHEEDEQRKTILSCALSGAQVAFFDNVKGLFGGEALEGVVTTGELKQRILGASVDVCVAWLATILVTGNNMTMTEDMLRRSLLCRIEPDVEDPTKRTEFAHDDLPEWVRSERPRLIVAALTMLRAYACHGYPNAGTGVMQSFHGWSRIVPGCIAFAGGHNVLEAIGTQEQAGSDKAGASAVFVRELARILNECGKLSLSTMGIINHVFPAPRADEPPDGWDDMREALSTLAPTKCNFAPDASRLGTAIREQVGRYFGGLKLVRKISKGAPCWAVEGASKKPVWT